MRKVLETVGSLKLAIGFLIVLAVVLAWGTIIESTAGREAAQAVYGAGWFRLLLVAFGLNVFASVLDRWPRNRYRIGFAVTHLAMLLILVGALVTDRFALDGQLALWEGQASDTFVEWQGEMPFEHGLPFGVRLDSFEIDTYPGTGRPAMFRSRVTVLDPARGERPAIIEMNKELAYGGFRFFQSSYRIEGGREMSVLSVSKDPGQPIVFLGYAALVLGMIVVLATRIVQLRRFASHAAAAAVGLALAGGLFPGPAEAATVPDAETIETARRLPVQHDGRTMPFDTQAREAVWTVTGLRSWPGIDPVAMVAGWHLDPDGWGGQPIVAVGSADLLSVIGLTEGTDYASFRTLAGNRDLLDLFERARAKRRAERPLDSLETDAEELEKRLLTLRGHLLREAVRAVPAADPIAAWDPAPLATPNEIAGLETSLRPTAPPHYPTGDAIDRELLSNRYRWPRIVWGALLVAGVAMALGRRREGGLLRFVVAGGVIAAFAVSTWGIGIRWQVAGRIPASNMYESMLFLSWGVTLFAVLALLIKNRLVLVNAVAMSWIAALLVDVIPFDSFIHPMPPVLSGTPWLAIHVPIIMVGYSVLALATLVAHIEIGVSIAKPSRTDLSQSLQDLLYVYIHIGSILLVAGILTGSIWAASSWGRYWGWDPKEVWSLIAFLAYMAILHARFDRMLGSFGVSAASILAFQTILMTYLGVNYVLAAGLHSYGFGGSKVVGWMMAVAIAELVFLGLGWWAHRTRAARAS